jgi:hypothetical protein
MQSNSCARSKGVFDLACTAHYFLDTELPKMTLEVRRS